MEIETKDPIPAGILTYAEAKDFSMRSQALQPSSSTLSISQDVFCSVCGWDDSEECNAIVLCDGCNVGVHQV